jgi:hypothetical protein
MKNITEFISEAASETYWIAVEVTTKEWGSDKSRTSQRVVSIDTYDEMRDSGQTKSGAEVLSISKLCSPTKDKDMAMSYLDRQEKKRRKTKLSKGDADYIVYAMNIGSLTSSGRTSYDWNFWDENKENPGELYTDYGRSFLWGAKGSLKEGDKVVCVDNDTSKKLSGGIKVVKYVLPASKEEFVEAYRKAFPTLCKRPTVAFGQKRDGIPWPKMMALYSIKGVTDQDEA